MARLVRFVLACFLVSCATTSGGHGQVDYAADAESNLKKGNEALEAKNFVEAEKYFEHVRTKYPFLEAANEAELKLGDTDFAREQYVEARDRYQNFVKLHPTHPKVDYAAYRAALTHYEEIPSDFFLLPPSREKDQAEVRGAARALADFVRQYPKSQFLTDAQTKLREVRQRLADHEMYVADFYAKRKRWAAVARRLETVVEKYPGLGFDEEALFKLHDAYVELNERDKAQQVLKRVIERLPNTPAAARAQRMLGS